MKGKGEGGPWCGMNNPALLEKLNLTPEQTAKAAELKKEGFKEATPLMEKLFSKRNELRLLWLEPTPDKDKIMAIQKEMRELRGQLHDKMTAKRVEFVNMLTPEQKAKLQAGFGPGSRRGHCCQPGGGPGFGPGPGQGPGRGGRF